MPDSESNPQAAPNDPPTGRRLGQIAAAFLRSQNTPISAVRSDLATAWDTFITTDEPVGTIRFFDKPPKPPGPDEKFPDNTGPNFSSLSGYYERGRLWPSGCYGKIILVHVFVGAFASPISDGVATLLRNGIRRCIAPLWLPLPMFHDITFQEQDRAFIDVRFTDPDEITRGNYHLPGEECRPCVGRGWIDMATGAISICGHCDGRGFVRRKEGKAFPYDPTEYARSFPSGTLIRCVVTVENVGLIDRH